MFRTLVVVICLGKVFIGIMTNQVITSMPMTLCNEKLVTDKNIHKY
jgi:hypothetical protein